MALSVGVFYSEPLAEQPPETEEIQMIARIWHGYTKPENADSYESKLKPELLPGMSKIPGYKGGIVLRRVMGEEVEFITIMVWESMEALQAVAGSNYTAAIIPEDRLKFLSHYDDHSAHYEIRSLQGLADLIG
jgi:antibiotic biosynthesis monooxygenase (ABM) superfamily enzyme